MKGVTQQRASRRYRPRSWSAGCDPARSPSAGFSASTSGSRTCSGPTPGRWRSSACLEEDLAGPLDRLLDAAEAARGRSARIDDRLDIGIEVFTGFQICPWAPDPNRGQCPAAGGVLHASVEWHLHNQRTGDRLSGPGLIVHLIRAHGFFEGFESPGRVDPRLLAKVLEL